MAQPAMSGNDAYLAHVYVDGLVQLRHRASGATVDFQPDFCVMYRRDDPQLHLKKNK
jgi:hypothetical protein